MIIDLFYGLCGLVVIFAFLWLFHFTLANLFDLFCALRDLFIQIARRVGDE